MSATPATREARGAAPDLNTDYPVTESHRLAAFESMAWTGWTHEQAMRYDLRRRLIEARAHQLRTREWQAQHSRATTTVRRTQPATGQWRTQRVAGDWLPDQTALPA